MNTRLIYIIVLSVYLLSIIGGCGESAAIEEQASLDEYILSNRIDAIKNGSYYYHIDSTSLDVDSLLRYPTSSNVITTHLRGSLTDGTIFGDSKEDNQRKPLVLGLSTNLIGGLKQGLQLFPKHSNGFLYIPPSLAYGDAGDIQRNVPSGAIIIYNVDMLGIFDNETAYNDTLIQDYLAERNLIPDTVISDVQVFITSLGDTKNKPDEEQVSLTYSISSLEDELFWEVSDENVPDTIDLSNSISGLESALPLFGVGGEGSLLIPSQKAYGAKGSDSIPSFTPIRYDFKLLSIIK